MNIRFIFERHGDRRMVPRGVAVSLLALAVAGPISAPAQTVTGAVDGFEPRFIDVDGIRTRYYDVGDGEPMLLVHGSGFVGSASANDWTLNLRGLSGHFRVFAVDKLASGLTGNPHDYDDLTIAGEVEHLADFIRTIDLAPVHLVGHSRGAAATLLLAVDHPDLVRTLVLLSSASAAPPSGAEFGLRRARMAGHCPRESGNGNGIRCALGAFAYDSNQITDQHVDAALEMWREPKSQQTLQAMTPVQRQRNADVTSEMLFDAYHRIIAEDALPMPVLVYWAKDDPQAIPAQGYALYDIVAEKNPRARFLMINRAGHVHFREHPEEFNRNIVNFVTYWSDAGDHR